MPRNLTPKQQAFIAAYQGGMTALDAAIHAGYSPRTAKQAAYQLKHKNKLVAAELAKAQQRLAEAAEYNGERCMAELDKAIAFAVQTKQPNAYVKAIELRARLAGLLRDKVDVTVERIDINGALSAARARIDKLRLPCDPTDVIEGEVVAAPGSAGSGSIDNKSTRLFGD